jgi:hypothetical protein
MNMNDVMNYMYGNMNGDMNDEGTVEAPTCLTGSQVL